jgi:Mrp family chromosome partitioning ATPase
MAAKGDDARGRVRLLPARPGGTSVDQAQRGAPVLTVDGEVMLGLARRCLKAGRDGLAAVGVAALHHGDGASTIARSVAACLATSFGKRVVLVEANLRSPCLRQTYRLAQGPGLSDVLAGSAALEDSLLSARGFGKLLVLPASTLPAGNPAALRGPVLRAAMTRMFAYADILVFDLAPVLPYPDTGLLCGSLDGVVLVLRAGQSRQSDSRRGLKALRDEGVPVLGAVLNREKSFIPRLVERMF